MSDLFPPMPSPKVNRGNTDDAQHLWEFLRMNMWAARRNKREGRPVLMQIVSAKSCCRSARAADRLKT